MTASDELSERLFHAGLETLDTFSVYIGDRLGYYRALEESGPFTSVELARKTDTAERYVREWLEQQAVTGFLIVVNAHSTSEERRYALPPGHAEVLCDRESLSAMAWLPRLLVAGAAALPRILAAFRSGDGVSWSDLGPDAIEGQADQNAPIFRHLLAREWLRAVPGLDDRLRAPGARVADIACGAGLAGIAIAREYPDAHVDGIDVDGPSLDLARANAVAAGVSDRTAFFLATPRALRSILRTTSYSASSRFTTCPGRLRFSRRCVGSAASTARSSSSTSGLPRSSRRRATTSSGSCTGTASSCASRPAWRNSRRPRRAP
jgi:hypothetical protein